jgi:HlyD family secretion protein
MAHLNLRIVLPLALIAALGIGGWYIDRRRDEERSTLSGFFESQPAEVSSRIGGRVARIEVKEGDAVRAGQPLVMLEAQPNRAENAARHAQAEQARAQQAEVEHGPRPEEIERQRAAVREAEAALLKLRHGPLPEEIGAARARLRQAEAMLSKARRGPRPQEIEEARAAERAAHAKFAQAQRGLTREEREQHLARELVDDEGAEKAAGRGRRVRHSQLPGVHLRLKVG